MLYSWQTFTVLTQWSWVLWTLIIYYEWYLLLLVVPCLTFPANLPVVPWVPGAECTRRELAESQDSGILSLSSLPFSPWQWLDSGILSLSSFSMSPWQYHRIQVYNHYYPFLYHPGSVRVFRNIRSIFPFWNCTKWGNCFPQVPYFTLRLSPVIYLPSKARTTSPI